MGANGIRVAKEGGLALNGVRRNLPSQLDEGAFEDREKIFLTHAKIQINEDSSEQSTTFMVEF